MKKTIGALAGLILMFCALAFLLRGQMQKNGHVAGAPTKDQSAKSINSNEPPLKPNRLVQNQTQSMREPASIAPKGAQALKPQEVESINSLSTTLAHAGDRSYSLNKLLEGLVKSGQAPLVARDANPDSGEMIIVRTKSPLPGTRYFHAQYFTSEQGERFVQHMSFEIKPGPESMATAISTVERSFRGLSRPKIQRDDFVEWRLGDNYIVWVKKMGADDLKDDPFNAYTISDNGTIRVAVELEIHGDSDGD